MALFGRKDKEPDKPSGAGGARPTMPRAAHCAVCRDDRQFSRCWLRVSMLTQCPCCALVFEDPRALYRLNLPSCPRCGEYLEHPGFEYGLCDACGSKFEIMPGAKPGLLPNKRQRDEMNRYGKAKST